MAEWLQTASSQGTLYMYLKFARDLFMHKLLVNGRATGCIEDVESS